MWPCLSWIGSLSCSSGSVRAVRCSLFRPSNNSVLLGPQIRTPLTFFLASGSTHSLPLAPYPFCLRTSRHLIVGALVYFCWLLGPADPLQLCPASSFLFLILLASSVLCLHASSFLSRHFIPHARILPQLAPGIVTRSFPSLASSLWLLRFPFVSCPVRLFLARSPPQLHPGIVALPTLAFFLTRVRHY